MWFGGDMFATYLTAAIAVWAIIAIFAVALCKGAARGEREMEVES